VSLVRCAHYGSGPHPRPYGSGLARALPRQGLDTGALRLVPQQQNSNDGTAWRRRSTQSPIGLASSARERMGRLMLRRGDRHLPRDMRNQLRVGLIHVCFCGKELLGRDLYNRHRATCSEVFGWLRIEPPMPTPAPTPAPTPVPVRLVPGEWVEVCVLEQQDDGSLCEVWQRRCIRAFPCAAGFEVYGLPFLVRDGDWRRPP